MNAWIVIAAAGLGSYLFRLSMIMLAGRFTTPAYLERAAGLVAPAAFAALAAAGIATACMRLGATQAAAPLAAVAVAIIAVLRTGSSYAAIVAGMPTLWITAVLRPAARRWPSGCRRRRWPAGVLTSASPRPSMRWPNGTPGCLT